MNKEAPIIKPTHLFNRRFLQVISIFIALAFLFSLFSPAIKAQAVAGITVTPITTEVVIDSNNSCSATTPQAMFIEVRVNNTTGAPITNLTATISNFTPASAPAGYSGSWALDSGANPFRVIGTIPANSSVSLYWYVNYFCYTGVLNGNGITLGYTVTVSKPLEANTTYNGSMLLRGEKSAAAGGILYSQLVGAGAVLGQVIKTTMQYDFGNTGANTDINIQPTANTAFDSNCFELVGVDVTSLVGQWTGVTTSSDNLLRFTAVDAKNSSMVVDYYFKAVCTASLGTLILPFADLGSGTQYKYLGNYGSCGSTPCNQTIPAPLNPFTSVTKTANPTQLPSGGTTQYTVRISNTTAYDSYIDKITDELPAGVTYGGLVNGANCANSATNTVEVTAANSLSIDSSGSPATVTFQAYPTVFNPSTGTTTGGYKVPAGYTLYLCYNASVQNVEGDYTNTVNLWVGTTSIGPAHATVTVGKLTLNVTTDIHDGSHSVVTSVPVGTTVHDRAAVSGSGSTPTGNMTFSWFTNGTCSGGAAATSTVALSGGSVDNTTFTHGPLNAGAYSFQASYAGDSNYKSATAACEPLTVTKASPTLTTNASPSIGTVGTNGTFGDTATISGGYNPSSSVTFTLYSNDTCTIAAGLSGSGTISGGSAAFSGSWTPSAVQTYYWQASYPGDTNNNAYTSACNIANETIAVGKASPSFTTSASPSTGTAGLNNTFGDTANFSGGYNPSGSVTFTLYSNNTCTTAVSGMSGSGTIASGSASWSASWTPPNAITYYWKASYAGDTNNNGYTSSCNAANEEIMVGKATPTVNTSIHNASGTVVTSVDAGSTIHDSASVTGSAGTPTGTVDFTWYTSADCTTGGTASGTGIALVAGVADPSNSQGPLNAGAYSFKAHYNGDSNYLAADSACEPLTVNQLTPTVVTSIHNASGSVVTSVDAGATVHDSAAVSGSFGTPTGTVNFTWYTSGDCTTGGTASGTSIALVAGVADPSNSQGPLASGSYSFKAHYNGDTNYVAADSACEPLTVNKLTPTITTAIHTGSETVVTSVDAGTTVHDSATVSGSDVTPSGTVNFTWYTSPDCTTGNTSAGTSVSLVSGVADPSTSQGPLNAGSYSFKAHYNGDSIYAAADSDCEPLTVNKLSPTISTSSSPATGTVGTNNTFGDTATIAGGYNRSGSVTFTLYSDNTCATTVSTMSGSGTISGGSASWSSSWTPSAAGNYYWKASYAGDTNNNAFTTGCTDTGETVIIGKASPAITTTASPATGTIGTNNTFGDTASILGGYNLAGQSVTFTLYSDDTCTTTVSGMSGSGTISGTSASWSSSWTPSAVGTYYWKASYAGDSNNNAYNSVCNITNELINIGQASPSITTSASPSTGTVGTNATFGDTATITGGYNLNGQSVAFTLYSDNACSTPVTGMSGNGTISGTSATWSKSWTPLAAGTYYWKANYAGDTNNSSFTTGCSDSGESVTIDLVTPSIATSASPSSGTVGVNGTFGDTATITGGYNLDGQDITFTLYSENTCTTAVSGMSGTGTISSGSASWSKSWTPSAAGTYYWKASFTGDSNNNAFTTGCTDAGESVTIAKVSPSITTSASPDTGVPNTSASFGDAATITGGYNLDGQDITFTLYSENTCTTAVSGMSGTGTISSGSASWSSSWTPSAAGTYYWQASYTGDSNNNAFTTGCTDAGESVIIGMASPTFTTSASPATGTVGITGIYGDTATITGGDNLDGQSITFTLYSENTCTTAVSGMSGTGTITSGSASWSKSWTPSATGTYYWQASYAGDSNNNSFTTGCTDSGESVTIGLASPSITTSASPSSGTVGVAGTFGDTATITGGYNLDGQDITFTLYTDDTCITDAGKSGTGTITSGSASWSTSWTPSAAGTYYWQAEYAGDANNNAFTTGCTDSGESVTISTVSPSITTNASPNTGTVGTTNTFGDTATVTGGYDLDGQSITFTLYSDNSCSTPVSGMSGTGTISSGSASWSKSWTPTGVGTYYWQADYAGDANNDSFTTGCTDAGESVVIGKASPTITTSASPSTGSVATRNTFGDTATLSGGYGPTGVIYFTLYADSSCNNSVTGMSGSGSISSGQATWSSPWIPSYVQTYYWQAAYPGDSNNNSFTTGCMDANEQIVVGKVSATVETTIHDASHNAITSAFLGTTVHDSAVVTSTIGLVSPSGDVNFTWYTNGTCAGIGTSGTNVTLDAGVADPSETRTPSTAGSYSFKAFYSGDSVFNSAESPCEPLTIQPAPAAAKSLILTNQGGSDGNNVFVGEILTYRVTLTIYPGTVNNLKLVDTLDEGLAFVGCDSITFDTLDTGGNPCGSETITSVGSNGEVDNGRQVEWDFGTIANKDTVQHTLTVTYRVVVLDSSANVRGKTLNNSAIWSWADVNNPTGPAVSLPPVQSDLVTILEPTLAISKNILPTTVSNGGQTTVTIVINHAPGSNADAFDMVWVDPLPANTEYVPGTINFAGLAPTTHDESNIYNLTATWDAFPLGSTATITFKIKVTLAGGVSAINTTNVSWTSLPGNISSPQSASNLLSTERFYDPQSPINIYGARTSATINGKPGTVVPPTGFAPGKATLLDQQPADKAYADSGSLYLEIPTLGQYMKIVGVPQTGNSWDISWLGRQAGYLQGTAFPTWNGNSVITAHVYDSNGYPGPFVNLASLKWGDKVIVHAYGTQYVYQVREVIKTTATDSSLLKHENSPWVTLITCQGYNAKTDTYAYRIGVRAVLINTMPEISGNK